MAIPATSTGIDTPELRRERLHMVESQIEAQGIHDPTVLAAMRTVPRHAFVDKAYRHLAYADTPLPSGTGKRSASPSSWRR